jgi:tetratricopeptide (TPR) repeat protein
MLALVKAMFRSYWTYTLLFLCASCGMRDPDFGSGPITLSPQVKASFEEYKARDAPTYFVVTESGLGAYYLYCVEGFNCTFPTARRQALDQCRRHYPGEECKIYAVRRSVVWQDADRAPQFSASDRLIRECLDGDTPEDRLDKCSTAIASPELAQSQKRGAFYVRARAYEQIGKIPEAERDYREVLDIDPKHAAAKARLEHLMPAAAPPGATPPKDT